MEISQRHRLNQVLDYGGQLISLPLLAWGLYEYYQGASVSPYDWNRGANELERELGIWLTLSGAIIWGGTRAALYVIDGQVPFVTKCTAQRRVLAVLKSWWLWGTVSAVACILVAAIFIAENPPTDREIAKGLAKGLGPVLVILVWGLVAWLAARRAKKRAQRLATERARLVAGSPPSRGVHS